MEAWKLIPQPAVWPDLILSANWARKMKKSRGKIFKKMLE